MANINKVLDRVRKLLSLSEHTTSEAEATEAASQAAKLMEEYQLSEALVRLDEPTVKPEVIVKERLEPDSKEFSHKRVAWKETIASAVALDLGVKLYYWHRTVGGRKRSDVRGMGRESAIQAWQYTCQYLWRAVDELTDLAWDNSYVEDDVSTRAWKNAFRVGCSTRIAVRLAEKRTAESIARQAAKVAAVGTDDRTQLAMTVVERDRDEVDSTYNEMAKGWGTTKSIGQVTSADGYNAGKAAGDRISLGGGRAGLSPGQGILTD
jgi:hypothetical protein